MEELNNLAKVDVVVGRVLDTQKMRGDLTSCDLSCELLPEMRTMALPGWKVIASRPDKFDWLNT
jgi:hypothetical protein